MKENLSNRQIFGRCTLSFPLQLRLEYIKQWTFEDSLSGKRKIWRLRTKRSGKEHVNELVGVNSKYFCIT